MTVNTMAAKIFAVLAVASSVAAEASLLGYRSTAGYHPGGAVSFSNRSPQGLSGHRGYYGGYGHGIYKREAEASFYGGASSYVAESRPYYNYGYGVRHHKRSAEPSYYGGYYGSGVSFQRVSRPYSGYGVDVYHG